MAATGRRLCTVAGEGWVAVGVGVGWLGFCDASFFSVTPVAESCLALNLHRARASSTTMLQPPAAGQHGAIVYDPQLPLHLHRLLQYHCRDPAVRFSFAMQTFVPLQSIPRWNRGQVQCKSCPGVKSSSRQVNLATTATTRLVDDASPLVLVKALAISRAKDEFHFAVSDISEFLELKRWHLCC